MPFVMPFVLYALGAALLGWSGLTIVRADGFGALDIAATLAGAGVLSIGLGAIAAAVSRAGGQIVRAFEVRTEPVATSASFTASEPATEPEADPAPSIIAPAPAKAPAPRVGPTLPTAPTLQEPPASIEERAPPPVAPSRSEAAMAVKRGLRPTVQVARPKRESRPAATPAAEFPVPRSIDARTSKSPKPAQEPRPGVAVESPKPVAEEPVTVSETAPTESAPPAAPKPVPARPVAAEPPTPVTLAPLERRPRPAAIEKKPALVAEPIIPSEPLAPAEPAQAAKTEPAAEPTASDSPGATTPEWLLRARARREARAKAESEAAAHASQAPVAAEPATQPGAAETAPRAEVQPPRVVLREGEHNGVTYRFLEGGAIEAESEHGTRHFSSIEELKATVARARGESGDPDAELGLGTAPTSEADALDAAILALEDAPAEEIGASRPA
ncbi:hypothetical protein ACFQI3_02960 [Hansschlegelia quercus]|uniref:Uncharacterized protein n=1 Tax=Hansschlegelia quercus TaxID=2528245 RepID=A0A4Q9GRX5_9HYPH|nr:hypothetical protein [Hansschlegelia quercus]TBN54880.1 hypothetical protein EYR15_01580 [Hansschlegelia quercus]